MSDDKRFLGITVMSPYFQSEGVDEVLRNLVERAGASAVATNTSVTAPSTEGAGSFQPPDDAGASVRLFDRPLWGRQALWLRSGPGHHADLRHYESSPYQPRRPNDLTDTEGPKIGQFIDSAKAAGLRVYIQGSGAAPPGLRTTDLPRLPNGELPSKRMAATGSLASDAIRQYNRAWVRDIFDAYPQIDGIRPDWPEYPCYTLGEAFQDFSGHVSEWAVAHDFDFSAIRRDVGALYDYVHGRLSNDDVADFASPDRGKYTIARLFNCYPGAVDWFRLKAALSADLLCDWRDAIVDAAGPGKELAANAFMPPYSYFTGLDFALVSPHCQSVAPKLYTMHWSLMVKFWGDELVGSNPGLDADLLARALANLFDIVDDNSHVTHDTYGYPEPDEPHPIPDAPQIRKINQVLSAVNGKTRVYALVHGYGPLDDFRRRLQLVADSAVDGVWINRYGYLSDEKLDVIREVWR